MTNMYTQFRTSETFEKDGIWLDYGTFRVRIARAGGSNKKYLAYAERKTKPLRRALQNNLLGEDQSKELLYDIYANSIVLAWEVKENDEWKPGIHKPDGSIGAVNAANVIQVFRDLPDLFINIQSAADDMNLFREELLEGEAKN